VINVGAVRTLNTIPIQNVDKISWLTVSCRDMNQRSHIRRVAKRIVIIIESDGFVKQLIVCFHYTFLKTKL
jgi:hypothetical protein